jgi:hypothetical protein
MFAPGVLAGLTVWTDGLSRHPRMSHSRRPAAPSHPIVSVAIMITLGGTISSVFTSANTQLTSP